MKVPWRNITEAFWWLYNHPMFLDTIGMSRFQECLTWDYVLVNPESNRISSNNKKNTKPRCWIELGNWSYDAQSGQWGPCHDIDLDCGAKTFDKALLKVAKLTLKKYGDYPRKNWRDE